jgi:pilus assembly protein CpaB
VKKSAIVVAAVAAIAGLGISNWYLARLEREISGGPRVPVLVAAKDIPIGSAVTEAELAVRDVPEAYLEARHVRASDAKKVLGVRTANGLRANEAVLWSDLATFSEHQRLLSGLVQNGMRAFRIDVRSADFDGLLRPGDRVDVLLTTRGNDAEGSATATLLQNVLVLSVGGDLGKADPEDPQTRTRFSSVSSVTLSTTVEQAQLLTQAREQGQLGLTLRNPDDIQIVEGIPLTSGKDVVLAKDRVDWRRPAPARTRGIEHVR